MSTASNPISLYGSLNCGVLLAITPEYYKIKATRAPKAGRDERAQGGYEAPGFAQAG